MQLRQGVRSLRKYPQQQQMLVWELRMARNMASLHGSGPRDPRASMGEP